MCLKVLESPSFAMETFGTDGFGADARLMASSKYVKNIRSEVTRVLSQPALAEALIEQAKLLHARQDNHQKADHLRNKAHGITEQLEALAEHLSKIPKGLSPALVLALHQIEGHERIC